MSASPTLSLTQTKGTSTPQQVSSPSQSQAVASSGSDGCIQRRQGSYGAAATSRNAMYSPRNSQPATKQHKGHRRPQLDDADAAAETAAITSTKSRKGQTSITHLMNFTLPPRAQDHLVHNFGNNSRRRPTWGLGSGYHAVDKARYINANYRFVVDPRANYRPQAVDADVHVDWSNVLQILTTAHDDASCPICLSAPVAPRMAKCGHIFCLPCLIRYMHSTDDANPGPDRRVRWKACPICWDSIYISETRPVRWFAGQEGEPPRQGSDVVLRLMVRQPGSTLALPRDGAGATQMTDDIPWFHAAEVMDYARIMKGGEDYLRARFDQEIDELRLQEMEDELMFGDETVWAKKAVAAVLEAKEKVKGIGNPPVSSENPEEGPVRRPPIPFNQDIPDFYAVHHAAKSGSSTSDGHTPTSSAVSKEQLTVGKPGILHTFTANSSRNSPFYFYQALPHCYLSSLDIRILKAAFGDYSAFPTTILPRVERVSTGHTIDDDVRRRTKYLAHLPFGCEYSLLECDWTDVVSPEILHLFATDIDRRRKKNREKEAREEKDRLRAEKEEDDKRWAAVRRKRPSITKEREVYSESLFGADDNDHDRASSYVDLTAASSSPPWLSSQRRHVSAFASLASPSTSPSAPRTVWGTAAVATSSPPLLPSTKVEHETVENDGWLQDWERDLLQEEELIARVQTTSLGVGGESSQTGATTVASGKKKKKQKITLMSTNARRAA